METSKQKILALKYRPKNFKELISQNIMVETIINSIKLNKLPNAYLLTGIRGVGKTTTARLIAQAINCKKDFIKGEECNNEEYCSCKEIKESKMLDCLEIDAASKTGIDSIRELIDSSQYAPTSAKFKVIILDEVQQLSKAAFSGLLKTLEEPPPHLKFIFCTTEIKKIPVTIVSRCQTFHLHRVSIKDLFDHLKKISRIENGKISDEALKLISKAAEGSVRDSLSLLDRALISQNIDKKEIDETFVRKMLGIADRSKILNLFNLILQGEQKKSVEYLRQMLNEGIQPNNLLNDFLEIIYFIQQNKILGNFDSELSISESEQDMISSVSKNIDSKTLIVFWQFILKVMDELSVVSNPILSIEMLVVRLVHLKDMPDYENLLDSIKNNNSDTNEMIETKNEKNILKEENPITKISKDQIKNTVQTKPYLSSLEEKNSPSNLTKVKISSFEDLIYLTSQKKEIQLKYDLEKNVNLIKFSEGKIDISFNQNLDKNFVRNLSSKLVEWTGNRWVITLSKALGKRTFFETENIKKKELFDKEKDGEIYKNIKKFFPDAELIEIKKKD